MDASITMRIGWKLAGDLSAKINVHLSQVKPFQI
jgi:hypothetical protein